MISSKRKKITMFLLTAAMLLGGCAKEPLEDKPMAEAQQEDTKNAIGNAMISEEGNWLGEGGCYNLQDPGLEETVASVFVYGEDIYSYSIHDLDNEIQMKLHKGNDTIFTTSDISAMSIGKSGIWIISDVTDYTVSNSRKYSLIRLGQDNQELSGQDISQYIEDSYVIEMRQDNNGKMFILLRDSVVLLDENGVFLVKIPLDSVGKRLVLGSDGEIYVVIAGKSTANGRDNQSITGMISNEAKNLSVICSLNEQSGTAEVLTQYDNYNVCDGREDYLFTLVNDDGLYGIDTLNGNAEPIALWKELGLSFYNLSQAKWMTEGRFLLQDRNMIVVLSPAKPSEIKQKEEITIASVTSWLTLGSAVSDFNLANDKYVVRIVDYTKKDQLSYDEAVTALNMDLLNGNYPDVIDFSRLPEKYYADKGLLEDIYAFIDNDPDVERENFMLLDKLETEGKLYYVPNSYYLQTAAGLQSRFGESYGWSLNEYLEIQSQYNGEMVYNITRENFLRTLSYRYAAEAVDWKAGTCNFESEEFIEILNAVSKIRENPESQNPSELDYTPGEQRLREGTLIISMEFVDDVTALALAEAEAGVPLSYIGWPTVDGSSGTQIETNNMLGICSKGNRQGAWEFIKYAVTKGSKFGLPIYRDVLEKRVEDAIAASVKPDAEVAFDEEDARRLYDLMEHSVYFGTASDQVINIILEEAAPFLAGDRTAQEAAHIIQSRVGILAAE